MPFLITPDERGTVFSANGAYVHLPDDDPIFESVAAELGEFTGRAVEAEKVMKAEALPDHLRGHASKPLLSTTRTTVEAARERAREFAVADQRAMTPPKSLDTSNAAEIRAIARSLDRSGKTAFVINATPVELAALMTPGNLANLPDEALAMAKDRALLEFHIIGSGIAGSHALQPSLARITAIGIDDDAARREGEIAIAGHVARRDQIEATEGVLQRLVAYVAAALGMPAERTLDRILAA